MTQEISDRDRTEELRPKEISQIDKREYWLTHHYVFPCGSFFIASPGFIINFVLYFAKRTKGSGRKMPIILNLFVGILVILFYHYLNISNITDFWQVILPSYIISILIYGFLILPERCPNLNDELTKH